MLDQGFEVGTSGRNADVCHTRRQRFRSGTKLLPDRLWPAPAPYLMNLYLTAALPGEAQMQKAAPAMGCLYQQRENTLFRVMACILGGQSVGAAMPVPPCTAVPPGSALAPCDIEWPILLRACQIRRHRYLSRAWSHKTLRSCMV